MPVARGKVKSHQRGAPFFRGCGATISKVRGRYIWSCRDGVKLYPSALLGLVGLCSCSYVGICPRKFLAISEPLPLAVEFFSGRPVAVWRVWEFLRIIHLLSKVIAQAACAGTNRLPCLTAASYSRCIMPLCIAGQPNTCALHRMWHTPFPQP